MTLKEAYAILKEQAYPKKPSSCIEYNDLFVFHFGGDEQLDFMLSVNKKTKKISPFFPLSLPPEEFTNPIKSYKFE